MEKNVAFGISINNCRVCETMDSAMRVLRALQFSQSNGTFALMDGINYRSAIGYDKEADEIVINEELLMEAIILANPGQERKKLRLVSYDEHKGKYMWPHK